jgi:hypothetical protein
MLAAIAASAFATVFMIYRTRDPVQFRRPSSGLGWVVIAAGASTAIPSCGAFSPAPVVLVLGIYLTSLGKSPRLAFVLYVVAASPGDRFRSASDLARALADALTGQLAPALRERGLALVRTGWADPPAAAARRRVALG